MINDKSDYLNTRIKELLEYDLTNEQIITKINIDECTINKINEVKQMIIEENSKRKKEYSRQYYINNKENLRKKQKIWDENHKESIKKSTRKHLTKKYGLTLEQYTELFNKQEGRCAICGRHQNELKQSLAIDHNHTTKKIRGLLCNLCNRGMGYLNDNIILLQKAIDYLKNNS